MLSEHDIEKAVEFLRDSAQEAAQARADRLHLEDFSRVLKSQIMAEHLSEPLGAQERTAYADVRYANHLEALKHAIYLDERFRFLREAASAKIEVWRSQLSWAKTQENIR